MVTRWGMSNALGMVQLAARQNPYLGNVYAGERPFSEATARMIDLEIVRIINEGYESARSLLDQHRKQLDALANALLERETLDEQEILTVTGLPPAPLLESSRVEAAVH